MAQISGILDKHFSFYRKLTAQQKEEFERRVVRFIRTKNFVPRGGLTSVTEEMQVSCAADAVQLTFGLKEIFFDHFKTILFYPSEFYSKYSLSYQTGEVHPDGYLVFSWKHLAIGNLLPEKSENIGLKVFAGALGIQNNTEGPEYDVLHPFYLRQWKQLADRDFEKTKQSGSMLFEERPVYTRENFFAVCAECFFEQPGLFKKEWLDLYNALSSLLNQRP